MSPELALVQNLLVEMEKHVQLLEGMKGIPRSEFTSKPERHLLAERCFQLAIQCLVDAACRLAADEGWPKPPDGAGAVQLLGERGVLPAAFVRQIAGIVNFRNILVHAYLHIDRSLVHAKLAEIEDFRTFQRHVLAYLAKRQAGGG